MSAINARVGRMLPPSAPESQSLASEHKIPEVFDANMYREPEYYIYIYTTSDRDFTVSQPPLFPRLLVRAKKPQERYALVVKIPSPFQQIDREGAIGDLIVRGHKAEQVAASLVNPNNPTLNQDAVIPAQLVHGFGVDLTSQGVFWSKNNPPTEEEVAKAEKRRENYYRGLLERARTLEISNPRELEFLINQDYHMAAEYFGEEYSWHRKMTRSVECPLCGEPIKPGIAAHKNSLGGVCVLDAERAEKMGLPKSSSSEADRQPR